MIVKAHELADERDQRVGWGFGVVLDGLRERGLNIEEVSVVEPGATADVWLLSLPYAGNIESMRRWVRARPNGRVLLGGRGICPPDPFHCLADAVFWGEADDHLDAIAAWIADPSVELPRGRQVTMSLANRRPWKAANDDDHGSCTYLEIARGCKQKCRFCEVGIDPYIERPVEEVREALRRHKDLVLSAPDTDSVSYFGELLRSGEYRPRWRSTRVRGYLSESPAPKAKRNRIRFGIEGVTEELRRDCGKPILDAEIEAALRKAKLEGYAMCRLFVIAGLPGETAADREHFHDLVEIVRRAGWAHWKSIEIKVTGFSPQWGTAWEHEAGTAAEAIAWYRAQRRARERIDPIWRSVMVDRFNGEADMVRRCRGDELLALLS
jgi:radical SAM superfamily enzyme YgiQ (UPF0313 family)